MAVVLRGKAATKLILAAQRQGLGGLDSEVKKTEREKKES